MKSLSKVVVLLALGAFVMNVCWADNTGKPRSLQGIEFLTGFATGKLVRQEDYQLIPLFVDFDFDLKPLLKKKNLNLPGLFQFVLEPFVAAITSPDNNAEIGNNFLIKIGFLPETSKFQPYFKGGAGLLYISQHTRQQSSQFNFNEYAGFGMHYFFKKNVALTVEYRFRHLSNCGISVPNHGINSHYGLCGVSYLF